jgi:perosamine synthetase
LLGSVNVSPSLNIGALSWRAKRQAPPSVLAVGQFRDTASGTAALALALRALGIGRNDAVLVPAYHCPSMIEPIFYCGATPRYYPIARTLEIDIAGPKSRWCSNARAIIVPHFFGLRQDVAAIRALGIPVIEDCAHMWFGGTEERPIGCDGDFAIASMPKFFPVRRGGILASRSRELPERKPSRLAARSEIKHLVNLFEEAADAGRSGRLARCIRWLNGSRRDQLPINRAEPSQTAGVSRSEARFQYLTDADMIGDAGRVARLIVAHSDSGQVVRARRQNYLAIADMLRGAKRARLFWDSLPSSIVAPYVLPVWLEQPAEDYPRLRAAGIRLFRWEETVRGECPVTDEFATHLVQFPCHQDLRADELGAVRDVISRVLT